jgi:hypothetical protein
MSGEHSGSNVVAIFSKLQQRDGHERDVSSIGDESVQSAATTLQRSSASESNHTWGSAAPAGAPRAGQAPSAEAASSVVSPPTTS